MSSIITPEFRAHFAAWIAAFDPARDRAEVKREYEALWESYPGHSWLDGETERELMRAIDELLGFEVGEGEELIRDIVHDAGKDDVPVPGKFTTLVHTSPGCCWDERKEFEYLVLARGLFTCKGMTMPELEENFALGFLRRVGEEEMVKKYLAAFDGATPNIRKFLDERVLRSYIHDRDNNLPPEMSGAGERLSDEEYRGYPDVTGWSGTFFRELYPGEVGTLQPCRDRAGVFYLVRRAGVFTCSVEFFEDRAAGEAESASMIRQKTEYAEAKRLEREAERARLDARIAEIEAERAQKAISP